MAYSQTCISHAHRELDKHYRRKNIIGGGNS
jgi:hypothetical protein